MAAYSLLALRATVISLFWKYRIFVFEMDTFLYLKLSHFLYFKSAHFVCDNKKASWKSNMENGNIRNGNIRKVKFTGQGQTAKIWSEGFILSFKVSNLSWKSNIENLNIQNVKFWGGKDKQRKSEMKVPMWLCKVSYVKYINLCN